jgi:hypothetical protein
MYFKRFGKVK